MRITILLLAGAQGACGAQIPALKEDAGSAVGLDVAAVRAVVRHPNSYATRIGWQEQTYTLPNGHWVYVEPDRPHCEIHYEVNGEDIIVAYTPVGRGCRHQ
jgi:hypothetical protein